MNIQKSAQEIIRLVGGEDNIQNVTHCFTRLRFVLKDSGKANKSKLERVEGVVSVVESVGEYQVVCGSKVERIFYAIQDEMGERKLMKEEKATGSALNNVLQIITQIFTPLIPAIAAAGLIKGLLTAAKLIMLQRGVDISTGDTYTILYSASQVIFYFFPIFLAMTTAKALKCNQVIAMVVAGTLVLPTMDAIIQDVATVTKIFGIPVTKAAWEMGDSIKVFSYTESVIPIILAIVVMAYLERLLKRIIPEVVQLILVPGLELILMLPLTLCVLGPIGIYIGNVIQELYDLIIGISPIFGGALIGGLWCVFVIFGAHRALIPIGLNDVALNGRQNILAFAGAANFAQSGAALGVYLKTKNKEVKQIATSGMIAAGLVGVTEPAIYGCNLRYKKPMVMSVIAGAIGGAIMGFGGVYGDAFANNGVLTIFTYAAFGMTKFIFYLVGIGVAFIGAAVLTYLVGFEEETEDVREEDIQPAESVTTILAPLAGQVIPLSEVGDEAFASGVLGQGAAIRPTKGEVVAPADCTVSVIYPSLHAVGLELVDGTELLIHVGIDTVKLEGRHFKKYVEAGDKIKKGSKIIGFDLDAIQKEGYDMATPVIVVDSEQIAAIVPHYGEADFADELFTIGRK